MQNISSSLAWDFTSSWCALLAALGCDQKILLGVGRVLGNLFIKSKIQINPLKKESPQDFMFFFECLQKKANISYSSLLVRVGSQQKGVSRLTGSS